MKSFHFVDIFLFVTTGISPQFDKLTLIGVWEHIPASGVECPHWVALRFFIRSLIWKYQLKFWLTATLKYFYLNQIPKSFVFFVPEFIARVLHLLDQLACSENQVKKPSNAYTLSPTNQVSGSQSKTERHHHIESCELCRSKKRPLKCSKHWKGTQERTMI